MSQHPTYTSRHMVASALLLVSLSACKKSTSTTPAAPTPGEEIQRQLAEDNPTRVAIEQPALCEQGDAGRRELVQAYKLLKPGAPAGVLRLYLFHTLRCLRMTEVGLDLRNTDPRRALVVTEPVDEAAVALMAAAYADEPRPRVRARMLERVRDLDVATRYALYARLLDSPHGIPIRRDQGVVAWPMPYGLSDALAQSLEPAQREHIRKAWCATVAPTVKARIARRGNTSADQDDLFHSLYFMTMFDNDCGEDGEVTLRLYLKELDTRARAEQFGAAVPRNPEESERAALDAFEEVRKRLVDGPAQWPAPDFVLDRVLATAWDPSRGSPRALNELVAEERSCGIVHATLKALHGQLQRSNQAQHSARLGESLRPWLLAQQPRCPRGFEKMPELTARWLRDDLPAPE